MGGVRMGRNSTCPMRAPSRDAGAPTRLDEFSPDFIVRISGTAKEAPRRIAFTSHRPQAAAAAHARQHSEARVDGLRGDQRAKVASVFGDKDEIVFGAACKHLMIRRT